MPLPAPAPELFGKIADAAACEERLMNCWPSHQMVVAGDWLCRFAKGYSGRANSACVTRVGPTLDDVTVEHIERLYRAAGLPPSFRLSPLVGGAVRKLIEAQGYLPEDWSIGMIGPTRDSGIPEALRLDSYPTDAWLEGACRWQTGAKRDVSALLGIVGNIRIPARFLTLHDNDEPAAYAMLALDRGMVEIGSVMVDPDRRGKGLGRKLLAGALSWGATVGASSMFLQVASDNAVAKSLYASLGFTGLYTAAYWRKRD